MNPYNFPPKAPADESGPVSVPRAIGNAVGYAIAVILLFSSLFFASGLFVLSVRWFLWTIQKGPL